MNIDNIILNLSVLKGGIKFVPNETVLIFDEIQECSGARASIKPFTEDGRFDVIASGSLLGIKGYNGKYHGGVSVGFEYNAYMKPMDFEEFLWAKGISDDVISCLKDCFQKKEQIRQPIHESLLRYFKEYLVVGGMPAVVDIYLKSNNYNLALKEQRDILESCKDDFGKHLNENEEEILDLNLLGKINKVYSSIPAQLAKENKKFVYSNIENRASAAKYDPAIQWLVDYGLVNYCYNLRSLDTPLEGNKIDNIFKLYIADTGLFIAMLEDGTAKNIMLGDIGRYKGYIYENIVADAFSKLSIPLYYFPKDSGLEIDFITRYKDEINLVEVKSKTGNTKAAKTILANKETYPNVQGLIKLGEYNISQEGNILHMPYYLSYLLKD